MLTGYDTRVRAFTHESERVLFQCRACTVKVIGEAAMQRLESGLTDDVSGWGREMRFSVDEYAVELGYEMATESVRCDPVTCGARWCVWYWPRPDSEPSAIPPGHGQAFCMACSVVTCAECGVRLDTTPEEEARDAD